VRSSLLFFLLLSACSKTEPEARKEPAPVPSATPSAMPPPTPPPPPSATAPTGPLVLAPRGTRTIHTKTPQDDAAPVIKAERAKQVAAGRQVVVYVGAKWCEPCQRFHAAVDRGELDEEFPNLTLLEFDLDESREPLATAGYVSTLIPLFVVPEADGHASNKRFEGSVKGNGAVMNIAPRLREILSGREK